MNNRLHVGITVVPTKSDFFFSLRQWVESRAPTEQFQHLVLPAELLETVRRVEYSPLWALRIFRYAGVIRFLEHELQKIVESSIHRGEEVIVYTPEDGYWAELLFTIRRKLKGQFKLLNIQHGMPRRDPSKTIFLRRLINRLGIFAAGSPVYGYGFGAGSLDGYIVMSDVERAYIEREFHTPAFVFPQFIKGDLLAAAVSRSAVKKRGHRPKLLFAMSPIFARASSFANLFGLGVREDKYFRDVADTLRVIATQIECEISVRFHPNQDRKAAERLFYILKLDAIAKIDGNEFVLDSLVENDFVISYASTVLMEGALLGRVPINWVPEEYPPPALSIPSEPLRYRRKKASFWTTDEPCLETNGPSLTALFSHETLQRYSGKLATFNPDVALPWLSLSLPIKNQLS